MTKLELQRRKVVLGDVDDSCPVVKAMFREDPSIRVESEAVQDFTQVWRQMAESGRDRHDGRVRERQRETWTF